MTVTKFNVLQGVPSAEGYIRLRSAAGLSAKTMVAADVGLANTWFGVIVQDGGQVIGMGRIIGDGALFFQIVDIAVEPRYQGQGLGKLIVGALVDHLTAQAPDSAYVSLIADGNAQHLYAQFGFEPTAPKSVGMALRIIR